MNRVAALVEIDNDLPLTCGGGEKDFGGHGVRRRRRGPVGVAAAAECLLRSGRWRCGGERTQSLNDFLDNDIVRFVAAVND